MEGNGGECVPVQLAEPSIKIHKVPSFICLPTGRQNAQKLPSPQGVPSQYQAEAKQRHVDLPWLSCWYVMFDPVTSCHSFYVCVCVCLFLSGLSTSHWSSRINRDKVQKDAEGP